MTRKLKTYQTSMGFFDLAIAAPSMKAALDAWGTKTNLFHQGVAAQTDDKEVVAATMAKPGVVLKRPVGSNGPFRLDAKLPSFLPDVGSRKKRPNLSKPSPEVDAKFSRKAARRYEQEERKHDRERQKEEADRKRRDQVISKVEAALEEARREHEKISAKIDADRVAVEKRSLAEDVRWEKERQHLNSALRKAKR